MAQYNSDGYIMLDFQKVDFKKTNQIIDGLFDRCRSVIGTNKFVLVINANHKTPLPSTVSITNGQYVIESCIYSFSISVNDNIHIKRNDVPASDIINDDIISSDYTWSSSKIFDFLIPTDTVTGNPATFNTRIAVPLVDYIINIPVTQEGSGTPSPDNVRPLHGWTQANIVNMSDITNKAYFEGLLNGTYGFVDIGTINWSVDVSGGNIGFYINSLDNAKAPINWNVKVNAISPIYDTVPATGYSQYTTNMTLFMKSNGQLFIVNNDYTDASSFKEAMSGVYLIYELATPATPTITDAQFEMLLSAFNINGTIDTVPFGQTVYGGTLDVLSGVLTVTHGNIASYNGESINEPWISSIDEYIEGTTPSTGAQVVYPLTISIEIQLTPTQIETLVGENNIFNDVNGDQTISYKHL